MADVADIMRQLIERVGVGEVTHALAEALDVCAKSALVEYNRTGDEGQYILSEQYRLAAEAVRLALNSGREVAA